MPAKSGRPVGDPMVVVVVDVVLVDVVVDVVVDVLTSVVGDGVLGAVLAGADSFTSLDEEQPATTVSTATSNATRMRSTAQS
jgi:hypothetical protein